jgi:ABC-2 type transport system permease protein
MNTCLTLVRREFWENRSLWIAPLSVAVLLLLGVLLAPGDIRLDAPDTNLHFTAHSMEISVFGVAALLLLVGSITSFSYLLDSLYAERKDRSILFWKSLPVSDTQTVLVKFAVAMLIVPLGIYLLEVVTYLFITGIAVLKFEPMRALADSWTVSGWLAAQGILLLSVLVNVLWFAPLAAYFMLVSVLAGRAPFVVGLLPPLVLAIGESILLRTNHVGTFLLYRMQPVMDLAEGISRPELWLGVLAAAAILAGVIRLRRYRDDT